MFSRRLKSPAPASLAVSGRRGSNCGASTDSQPSSRPAHDPLLHPRSRARRRRRDAAPTRSGTRSTSRATPRRSATTASGSPSTTTWWGSRAPRRASRSAMSPAAPRRSASAPAASCCRTTRRSSSPSSSARSPRSIRAASTSASAARPAPTRLTLRALRRDPMAAESFPQDVLELQALLGPVQPGPDRARRSRRRHQRAALDSRLEPLRRAARGDARPALRLRLAFRAGCADAGARGLSRDVSALRAARSALCDGRLQRHRRRHRRGGAPALHLRRSRPSPTCMRGTRGRLQPPIDDIESYWNADGEGAGRAHARPLLRRRRRRPCGRASKPSSPRRRPTRSSSRARSTTIRRGRDRTRYWLR